jgi:hypothetical protein
VEGTEGGDFPPSVPLSVEGIARLGKIKTTLEGRKSFWDSQDTGLGNVDTVMMMMT